MIHPTEGTTQGKLKTTGFCKCEKDSRGFNTWHYEVICACGKTYFISRVNWFRGVSSCLKCRKKPKTAQPLRNTRIYNIWANMLARCRTETNKAYKFYGAKGIKVCAEWHNINTFNLWAQSNGYAESLTIDRIDPDKDYEPSNCRWISADLNIRRRQKVCTYPHGETFTSALDAAKYFNCHDQHIRLLCRSNAMYKSRWFYYE